MWAIPLSLYLNCTCRCITFSIWAKVSSAGSAGPPGLQGLYLIHRLDAFNFISLAALYASAYAGPAS